MKKIFVTSLCLIHFTCYKTDVIQHGTANLDPRQWASGGQINSLSQQYNVFCGGVKTCKFLYKYDDSMWADTDNYYSEFSDIKFKNAATYFISFFKIDNDVSYCKGWQKGENIYNGIKWDITIKKDEWDVFWFDFDYYGTGQEIEYTITYKYEVIDGLLHFSNSEDQSFIFHPSKKNYSKELIDTKQIIEQEGCLFL